MDVSEDFLQIEGPPHDLLADLQLPDFITGNQNASMPNWLAELSRYCNRGNNVFSDTTPSGHSEIPLLIEGGEVPNIVDPRNDLPFVVTGKHPRNET